MAYPNLRNHGLNCTGSPTLSPFRLRRCCAVRTTNAQTELAVIRRRRKTLCRWRRTGSCGEICPSPKSPSCPSLPTSHQSDDDAGLDQDNERTRP